MSPVHFKFLLSLQFLNNNTFNNIVVFSWTIFTSAISMPIKEKEENTISAKNKVKSTELVQLGQYALKGVEKKMFPGIVSGQ